METDWWWWSLSLSKNGFMDIGLWWNGMDIIWNEPGYISDGFGIMNGLIIALDSFGFELNRFKSGGIKLELSSSGIVRGGIWISICFIDEKYVLWFVWLLYIKCFWNICDFN